MGKEKILHTPHKTNTKTPHVARQTTVSYYRNPWALSCYSRLRKVGISCGPWRAWKHVVSKESKLWRLAGNACLLCIDSDALSFGPGIGPRSLTLFPFFPPSALVLSLCVMYSAEERLRVCLSFWFYLVHVVTSVCGGSFVVCIIVLVLNLRSLYHSVYSPVFVVYFLL